MKERDQGRCQEEQKIQVLGILSTLPVTSALCLHG